MFSFALKMICKKLMLDLFYYAGMLHGGFSESQKEMLKLYIGNHKFKDSDRELDEVLKELSCQENYVKGWILIEMSEFLDEYQEDDEATRIFIEKICTSVNNDIKQIESLRILCDDIIAAEEVEDEEEAKIATDRLNEKIFSFYE